MWTLLLSSVVVSILLSVLAGPVTLPGRHADPYRRGEMDRNPELFRQAVATDAHAPHQLPVNSNGLLESKDREGYTFPQVTDTHFNRLPESVGREEHSTTQVTDTHFNRLPESLGREGYTSPQVTNTHSNRLPESLGREGHSTPQVTDTHSNRFPETVSKALGTSSGTRRGRHTNYKRFPRTAGRKSHTSSHTDNRQSHDSDLTAGKDARTTRPTTDTDPNVLPEGNGRGFDKSLLPVDEQSKLFPETADRDLGTSPSMAGTHSSSFSEPVSRDVHTSVHRMDTDIHNSRHTKDTDIHNSRHTKDTDIHTPIHTKGTRMHTLLRTKDTDIHTPLRTKDTDIHTPLHTKDTDIHIPLHTKDTDIHTPLRTKDTDIHTPLRTKDTDIHIPLHTKDTDIHTPLRTKDTDIHIPLRTKDTDIHTPLRTKDTDIHTPLRTKDTDIHIPLHTKDTDIHTPHHTNDTNLHTHLHTKDTDLLTLDEPLPTHTGSYVGGRRRYCFRHQCLCFRNVANCSHNNGRLTFVPRLPKRIQHLLFSYNALTHISNDTFFKNVTEIVSIDLSNNGLVYIHPDAFKPLKKLTRLILDRNGLNYPDTIQVLASPSLEHLSIGFMSLGPIPEDYFSGTPMAPLRSVNLTGNKVENLNLSVFSPLTHLTNLAVADSRVIIITSAYLPHLKHLDLQSNALFDFPDSCSSSGSSLLPHLRELKFAQNKFSDFETDVCLPELMVLDLSKNPVSVLSTDMFNGTRFPRLKNLTLDGIQNLVGIQEFAFRSPTLERLSLMFCNIPFSDSFVHPDCFHGIPRLIYLQLSHNLGSYIPDDKFERLFASLNNLLEFNLGTCGIQHINKLMFSNMSSLVKLKLYRNKLTDIPDDVFGSLKHLRVLSIGDNELTTVRESTFSEETRRRLKQLDLSGNLFVCDCDLLWFQRWFLSSSIFRYSYRDYRCYNIPGAKLASFTKNPQACIWSHQTYSAIIACFFVFFVLLCLASAVYHFRWHIRLMLAFRGHSDLMKKRLQAGNFDYDIFVSFACENLPWVQKHLMPKLEQELGLRLCIHERDFQPGKNILNNIVDSVKSSKKYMMIFSRHFAASPWCQFELDLCLGHVMDYDDALIVTCLDDVASRDMTSTMAAVLKTTTYIQWRKNPCDVTSFWRRIQLAVRGLTTEIL